MKSKILAFLSILASIAFTGCNTNDQWVEDNKNRLCVSFDAPHPGWVLAIQEVWEKKGEFYVYAEVKVKDPNAMYPQIISVGGDCVPVMQDGKPFQLYLAGKTWNWESIEGAIEVAGSDEFRKVFDTKGARKRFPR